MPEDRYVFPSNPDRLVYEGASRRGTALVSAEGRTFTVHVSVDGPLAAITTLEGEPIAGSRIAVGAGSMLTPFLGPPRSERLWIRDEASGGWTEIVTSLGNTVPIPLVDGGYATSIYTPPLNIDGGNA